MGFETPNNTKEKQEKLLTEEEFKEKTAAIIESVLVTNVKDSDFDLNKPEDRSWIEEVMDTKKMLDNGNYKKVKFFAGPDGLRVPKWHETPEGVIREGLQRNKELIEKAKKEHPNNWKDFVSENAFKDIEDRENLLNFLYRKTKKDEPQKEQKENEKSKERLEGEELFNQQIENNAHPEAKNIKTDVIFFLSSLDGHNIQSKLENYKEEIGEILYRQNIKYEAGKEIKIPEKDRELLEPLLEFRKELDEWNTFSDPQVADYRKRVFGYLKDTFGIEESKPKEGEKFNGKEEKAIQAVETNNKFLDKLIKKSRKTWL